MTKSQHDKALETCINCLEKNISLAAWIAFGITHEERLQVIEEAKKALGLSA